MSRCNKCLNEMPDYATVCSHCVLVNLSNRKTKTCKRCSKPAQEKEDLCVGCGWQALGEKFRDAPDQEKAIEPGPADCPVQVRGSDDAHQKRFVFTQAGNRLSIECSMAFVETSSETNSKEKLDLCLKVTIEEENGDDCAFVFGKEDKAALTAFAEAVDSARSIFVEEIERHKSDHDGPSDDDKPSAGSWEGETVNVASTDGVNPMTFVLGATPWRQYSNNGPSDLGEHICTFTLWQPILHGLHTSDGFLQGFMQRNCKECGQHQVRHKDNLGADT